LNPSTPDILIRLAGAEISACARLSVKLSNSNRPGRLELSIPNVAGKYNSVFRVPDPADKSRLKDSPGKRISLFLSLSSPSAVSRQPSAPTFTGFSDSTRFSYRQGIISLDGPDWSGILCDDMMSPDLAARMKGRTASSIVSLVAKQYGFAADVDATTKVWSDDNAFPDNTSIWSVLCDLATKEGFDLYCRPSTLSTASIPSILVFKKRSLPTSVIRTYHVPCPGGDMTHSSSNGIVSQAGTRGFPVLPDFEQDDNLSLALKVKVIGYDQKRKQRITFTAESPQRNRPNYKLIEIVDHSLGTKDLVRRRAETALTDVSKNLLVGELELPIDPELAPGQAIAFIFDGDQDKSFEGKYLITDVEHSIIDSGLSTTTLTFASKPLAESRDIEIEELKPPNPIEWLLQRQG